ncbi:conserved hypothetical protein [Ricinus communis]|uniref:Uncharacterized protein n=1 Tax=Ricinus communis TaxID=3988 RepID=B9RSF6_RICCO|nr:conserved hypothetical protein [Ricinus communis]
MSHVPDNLVSEQSDPDPSLIELLQMARKNQSSAKIAQSEAAKTAETAKATTAAKAAITVSHQLQDLERHVQILDQRGQEFMRETYSQLEAHRRQLEEQHSIQQGIQASQQTMQKQMGRLLDMMKAFTHVTPSLVLQQPA